MSYTRIWCLRSESNQRHADFQSAALPAELRRHLTRWERNSECRSIRNFWRYRPDLNWGMRVLQTLALPLGYGTIKIRSGNILIYVGAGDEARTRYLHLGKVALYRMSYTRIWCLRSESNQRHADFQSAALPAELRRHGEQNLHSARCEGDYEKSGDPERTRTVDLQRDRLAC